MAQGNMLLGMARGSVGDVTFARSARKQVSRARNRKPNNPRTLAQISQRIFLKTAALAYQKLAKDIADQTFEGSQSARENQQKFIRYNVEYLKSAVSGTKTQYAMKGDNVAPINAYVISRGQLRGKFYLIAGQDYEFQDVTGNPFNVDTEITYREFAEKIGLPAGAQLTIVQTDGQAADEFKIRNVIRGRVILAPEDGNLDKAMFTAISSSLYQLNDPNSKNDGPFKFHEGDHGVALTMDGVKVGMALVASHFDKRWRYSDTSLFVTAVTSNNFDDAVASWQMEGAASEEYTRQAE